MDVVGNGTGTGNKHYKKWLKQKKKKKKKIPARILTSAQQIPANTEFFFPCVFYTVSGAALDLHMQTNQRRFGGVLSHYFHLVWVVPTSYLQPVSLGWYVGT